VRTPSIADLFVALLGNEPADKPGSKPAIRPAGPKEQRNDYATQCRAGVSLGSQAIAQTVLSPTRPLYWSIRRELWENRSIYIAPLAAAAVYLFGFLISLFGCRAACAG